MSFLVIWRYVLYLVWFCCGLVQVVISLQEGMCCRWVLNITNFIISLSTFIHALPNQQQILQPQKKTRVRIWLVEDTRLMIEGQIIGFDEYMNMVLEDAVEIDSKKNKRLEVGRILLKGDSITALQEAQPVRPMPAEGAE